MDLLTQIICRLYELIESTDSRDWKVWTKIFNSVNTEYDLSHQTISDFNSSTRSLSENVSYNTDTQQASL